MIKNYPRRPEPEPDPRTALSAAVQAMLERTAASRGYGDSQTAATVSIATYDNDLNPVFAAEAAVFKAFRSAVWTSCYAIMAQVVAGQRPIPTEAELLSELPVITWPGV